jgi:hypothetical protein
VAGLAAGAGAYYLMGKDKKANLGVDADAPMTETAGAVAVEDTGDAIAVDMISVEDSAAMTADTSANNAIDEVADETIAVEEMTAGESSGDVFGTSEEGAEDTADDTDTSGHGEEPAQDPGR